MSIVRARDSGFVVVGENASDLMKDRPNQEDKLRSEQCSPIKFQMLGLDMRCGKKTGDKPSI